MTYRFQPIPREPAYVKVYQAMEADILSGRLAPGLQLPTEGEMAEQFGVNRSTVREGVRLLEQSGLIRRGAAKRWFVSRPDTALTAATAARGLIRHGVTFIEAWEALALVQPEIAALAAKRMSKESLKTLAQLVDSFRRAAPHDHEATIRFASRFFEGIAQAVENRALAVSLFSLNELIARSLHLIIEKTPQARARIMEAQTNILDALECRDEAAARLWMRRHIEDLKRGFEIAGQDLNSRIV